MKTALKKIVIDVGGKKLEFTPDEAKELKNILADLFGADKTVHVHHHDYWRYWTSVPTTYTYTNAISSNWSGSYDSSSAAMTITATGYNQIA